MDGLRHGDRTPAPAAGRLLASLVALVLLSSAVVLAGPGAAEAAKTKRASVSSAEAQANDRSDTVVVSGNGRFVVFRSLASNLVPGDTNGSVDIFIRDRRAGTTRRVSVSSAGAQGNAGSYDASVSANGRFVAFISDASNLVAGDTNGRTDVFLRDRKLRRTTRLNVGPAGEQANGFSQSPSVSADGRFVAFTSSASNLIAGDLNAHTDVFVRDRKLGRTIRASVSTAGVAGNNESSSTMISADGRFVMFESSASNLVAGDTNAAADVFVHNRRTGRTTRASLTSRDGQPNDSSIYATISGNGRYVAFESGATNMVPRDTNGETDVYVRDRRTGTTRRVSRTSAGRQVNNWTGYAEISANGRFVLFQGPDSNLAPRDRNGCDDVYVHDRRTGTTRRVTVRSKGASNGNGYASISADGRVLAFESDATDHVRGDTNAVGDIFVRAPLRWP